MSRFIIKQDIYANNIQYYHIFDTHFNEIYLPDIPVTWDTALGIIVFMNHLYSEEYHRGFQDGIMDMKGKLNDLIDMSGEKGDE